LRRAERTDVTERLNAVYADKRNAPDEAWLAHGLEVLRRAEWEDSVERGEIWWAGAGRPRGSERGRRRPVLVVQSDDFNRSRIATAIAVAITTNMNLAFAPGNVVCRPKSTGLPHASVINVSQVATVDRKQLTQRIGRAPEPIMEQVDEGLRLVLAL